MTDDPLTITADTLDVIALGVAWHDQTCPRCQSDSVPALIEAEPTSGSTLLHTRCRECRYQMTLPWPAAVPTTAEDLPTALAVIHQRIRDNLDDPDACASCHLSTAFIALQRLLSPPTGLLWTVRVERADEYDTACFYGVYVTENAAQHQAERWRQLLANPGVSVAVPINPPSDPIMTGDWA